MAWCRPSQSWLVHCCIYAPVGLNELMKVLIFTKFASKCIDKDVHVSFSSRHDDVIKLKHFQRNWPFVRGIHRSPMNSPHKGQWRGALMFSLTCAWMNDLVNNREAGALRRHRANYDVTLMGRYHLNQCWPSFPTTINFVIIHRSLYPMKLDTKNGIVTDMKSLIWKKFLTWMIYLSNH